MAALRLLHEHLRRQVLLNVHRPLYQHSIHLPSIALLVQCCAHPRRHPAPRNHISTAPCSIERFVSSKLHERVAQCVEMFVARIIFADVLPVTAVEVGVRRREVEMHQRAVIVMKATIPIVGEGGDLFGLLEESAIFAPV